VRLEAVSNSGPFIHLWQIGQLQLLAMFNRLLTTEQVIAEITASGRLREEDLAVLSNLQICSVTQDEIEDTRKQLFGFELHAGELSALRLAQKEEVELFLTDDLEARRAAKSLGLEPHGSVGILVLAYRKGILSLSQTEEALFALLHKSSLFLTPAIVEQAIQLIKAAIGE
jgi:Predicted nucleic acid-binding protein, contains PIN domain